MSCAVQTWIVGVINWVMQSVLPSVPVFFLIYFLYTYSGCELSVMDEEKIEMKLISANGCNVILDTGHMN